MSNECAPGEARNPISADAYVTGGDGGSGLVFWILVTMAVGAFAPCVILPSWREYETALIEEGRAARDAAAAAAEADRLRRHLDAVHNDPAVVGRLARRELGLRQPGEELLPVVVSRAQNPLAPPPRAEEAAPLLSSAGPPVPIARFAAFLPRLNYDALFCESPSREMIMAISLGLFVGAFLVFWPKRESATA